MIVVMIMHTKMVLNWNDAGTTNTMNIHILHILCAMNTHDDGDHFADYLLIFKSYSRI